jgi:hypothetical protein
MKLSREVLTGIWVSVLIVVFAGVVIYFLPLGLSQIGKFEFDPLIKLPILAVVGVVALMLSLAAVSVAFAALNLADKTQALALPEGSVRAVIALCLLVLFAIITIFLFGSLSDPGIGLREVTNLRADEKDELLKQSRNLTSVVVIPSIPVSKKDKQEKGDKQEEEKRYTVVYRENADADAIARQRAKEDFAKQLLILIGTLVTAVASFYFGTRAATPTQAAEARAAGTLASVTPSKVSAGSGETPFEISGNNLDLVREVKLVRGSNELIGTAVTSNAQVVKFTVSFEKVAEDGPWDVVATDASQRVLKLQGAVEVTKVAQATTPERLDPSQTAKTAWPNDFRIQGKNLDKVTVVRFTREGVPPVVAKITNRASDTLVFTVEQEKLTSGKWEVEVLGDKDVVLGTPLALVVTD